MFNNQQFYNAINAPVKEINSIVIIDGTTYSDTVISVNPYYEGNLLCSIMKCCAIEIQFTQSVDASTATAFKGKTVSNVKIGVKQASDAAFAYKDYGQFTVYSAEYKEASNSVYLICYDDMLDAMKPYNISDYSQSRTVYEFLSDICTALGWTLTDLTSFNFPNRNFSIPAAALNSYLPVVDAETGTVAKDSSYTFRDALDDIAEMVAGNLMFVNGELCLVYPSGAYEPGNNSQMVNVSADLQREISFEKQFGPINKVVLIDSEGGNAVPATDDTSINQNGECQISIVDNPLANSNRSACISAIFNKLSGLYYTPFTASSFGIGYLDFGDIFYICDSKGNSFRTILLSDNFLTSVSVREVLSAKTYAADSETEYSVSGPLEKVKIDLKQLMNKSAKMNERLTAAQTAISNATSGHAVLVDLEYDSVNDVWYDGGGEADTLILSQNPAVGFPNWSTGRVIKINNDGMGVSTQGIGGPYSDFAIYYDSTLGKYCVNADDIAVGTLQGIKAILEEGDIGGWIINQEKIFQRVKVGTKTYEFTLKADSSGDYDKKAIYANTFSNNRNSDSPDADNYKTEEFYIRRNGTGKIAGWDFDEESFHSDYTDSNNKTFRTFIQNAASAGANSWVFSVQEKTGPSTYSGKWLVKADGTMRCNNNIILPTSNSVIKDANGNEILNPYRSGALVIGFGYYQQNYETYIEGGKVKITAHDGNSNQSIFTFDTESWTMPYDNGSYYNRSTLRSSGGLVIDAANGNKWMYLRAGTVVICCDLRLNIYATSGSLALYVNSNGVVTTSSSSKRYKENIKDVSEELNPEKLYDLPIVQFNYKSEYKDKELVSGTQIGILAEDIEKYYPNALIRNEKGEAENWQDRILIPAMLKLIQEQKKEIDELKQKQLDIEQRLSALEAALEA